MKTAKPLKARKKPSTLEPAILAELEKVASSEGFRIELDQDATGLSRFRLVTAGGNFRVGLDLMSPAEIADLLDPTQAKPRTFEPRRTSLWGRICDAVRPPAQPPGI